MNFTKLPNFFLIGAAKAGTTSLYDILKQHPQVYLPFQKEPMFFSNDNNFNRGMEWYSHTFFQQAAGYPARGEATPHYLYWSDKVAPRIRQIYEMNEIKFVVILRDPVKRAYSWYWNMVKEGMEELTFELAIKEEDHRLKDNQNTLQKTGAMTYGYIKGGCYSTALQPFLDNFPRQDFIFILQEDLNSGYLASVKRLLEFLGINQDFLPNLVSSNQATQPRSRRVQSILRGQSKFREFLKLLFPLQFRYALKKRLLRANEVKVTYPDLDPVLEAELRVRFAPEVRRLEQIIDQDLSNWLP